jgi:hypothetical protein
VDPIAIKYQGEAAARQAINAGFGVAWPMSDNARLFGMIELATRSSVRP